MIVLRNQNYPLITKNRIPKTNPHSLSAIFLVCSFDRLCMHHALEEKCRRNTQRAQHSQQPKTVKIGQNHGLFNDHPVDSLISLLRCGHGIYTLGYKPGLLLLECLLERDVVLVYLFNQVILMDLRPARQQER